MSLARKHHTVARSLLRRFAADDRRTQVYVFDKMTGRMFLSSIEDAAAERDFNTVEFEGAMVSYEELFDEVDGKLAALVDRLVREQTVACLDAADRRALAEIVAVQVLRTKMPRTTIGSTAEQLAAAFTQAGFEPGEIENFSIPTDQQVRRAALAMLVDADRVVSCLERKRTFLVRSNGPDQPLWISDNPVALQQTYPYGNLSLEAPGIEIYFPISRDLALALFCPSIQLQMGRALASRDPRLDAERFAPIYQALQSGGAVSLGPGTTNFLNQLQTLRSSRFLYGPTADFELAQKVLDHGPEARRIEGFVSVGKMGQGSPPRRGMPSGLCIVFLGQLDHHVLHVDTYDDDEHSCLSVTTRDVVTLRRVLRDQPLKEAVLYDDGWERGGMRDVRLEVIDGTPLEVHVRHRDESLNELMSKLKR